MFVRYIDSFWNWNELNETQQPGWRSRFHQSESGVWYENVEVPKQIEEEVEKPKEEVDFEIYRNYLKEKKVRWWQLLKWDVIKTKAIENWYLD